MALERVYRVHAAAVVADVCDATIVTAIKGGRLRARNIGDPGTKKHCWIITESGLAEWLGATILPDNPTIHGEPASPQGMDLSSAPETFDRLVEGK